MKIYNLTQIYSIKQIKKKQNNRYALKNKSVKIDRDNKSQQTKWSGLCFLCA